MKKYETNKFIILGADTRSGSVVINVDLIRYMIIDRITRCADIYFDADDHIQVAEKLDDVMDRIYGDDNAGETYCTEEGNPDV
jgi:hypothetical protein